VQEPTIQILILINQLLLISKIEEVVADIGQPDCRLVKPYLILDDGSMIPWLSKLTNDTEIMISSDKILTLVEPTKNLLNDYLKLSN